MGHRRRQRGLTLIEALITLVVLGIGLAGAARFQAFALQTSREIRDRQTALTLTEARIESARHAVLTGQLSRRTGIQKQRLWMNGTRYHLVRHHRSPGTPVKEFTFETGWTAGNPGNPLVYQTVIGEHDPARQAWRLH